MIDLCIDARMAFFSGIGTCIRELVPYFNQPPFRLILLVDRLDQTWCKGVEQVLFPAPIYSVKEQIAFPTKIPKCDLFWSPHYNIPLLPIRAKKRIVTIHDACHLALGKYLSGLERMYAKIVMGRALRRSDVVITDSHFSKSELCRYLGQRPIEVIPVAVNQSRFERKVDIAVRDKYQLPERFVLFVGNYKPHKNVKGLEEAFAKVDVPGLKLVMVGKGTSVGQVLDEELPILYSLAEMFILPSFYEGFGLPPLEAMSCGCPTVVSNAASLPEVCGEASLYFHPERKEEMAEAIKKVALDPELKRNLIEKGFERIKQFNWARTAAKYRTVFEGAHRL